MSNIVAIPSEFQRSLKPLNLEEAVDYYFFRRLAFRLVPLFIRLRVSPNTITTLSLFTGLMASWCVLRLYFGVGALLALMAIIFDCCDGQVARLTGQASPLGRAMDGLFDLIWVACFWLAIYHGGRFQALGYGHELLGFMIFAAVAMILHCWNFDAVKIKYLELVREDYNEKDLDVHEAWALMKLEWCRFRIFNAFIALILAFQMYFFVRGGKRRATQILPDALRQSAAMRLGPIVQNYTWLGEGTHNVLVILGVAFLPHSPWPLLVAFTVIAGPMNLWWFWQMRRWRGAIAKLLIPRS